MNTKKLVVTISAMLVLLALDGIQQADALDTDIYLKSQALVRDDSPNVLIILDNSGSMDTDIVSRPPYDPSIDYCTADLNALYPMIVDSNGNPIANKGKPNNCSTISGRIYFSFDNKPPSISSSSWFSESKNKCIDSYSPLNTSGRYQASSVSNRIAKWRAKSGGGSGAGWRTLRNSNNSDITYVDCQADGKKNGQSANDGTYPRNSDTTAYGSSGSEFNWNNFNTNSAPMLFSANYMNYWHNSSLVSVSTRMAVAQNAVKNVIDSNTTVRFGLMVFNSNESTTDDHGGRVIYRIATMDDARRADMKNTVDNIFPDGFTPLAETLWEAYRYFAGLSVDYGDNDSTAKPARDLAAESSKTYISPFAYACQKSYILYVTDGDPTNDTNANTNIKNLIGKSCDGDSCLDDLAGWMRNNDVHKQLPNDQFVSTYTIGFGDSISADGLALLQETATEGGGRYFDAKDADQLASALHSAIAEILQETTSFSSPSLSVNAFSRLFNRDEIYFALFLPSNSCAWDGNVKKYKLCTTADMTAGRCSKLSDILDADNIKATDQNNFILDTARSYWSSSDDGPDVGKGGAGEKVPAPANRKLYTYPDDYSTLTTPTVGVEVKAESGNAFYTKVIGDPTLLGMPSGTPAADVASLINWMRGEDVYDEDSDKNTTTRWVLGDLLHSRPAALTYGAEPDGSGKPDPSKPIIKLFFGTNDGVIHMINDSTGEEEWAFVPKELYAGQFNLAQRADGEHIAGMDGSPTFWIHDTNRDGVIDPAAGDKVYMYFNMRRGGRHIYAFDVTPPTKLTSKSSTFTPKLMWVIEGGTGDFAALGQTWSRPFVTRIRVKCSKAACDDGVAGTPDSEGRIVLIFAGGYDPNQDNGVPAGTDTMGNAIYIVDPLTGKRLWWAGADPNADLTLSAMKYSIPSDIAFMDSDGDNAVDRLYVGDTGGQIWRIDLSDQIDPDGADKTARNGGSTGYVFADIACNGGTRTNDCASTPAQHRRKFFYPPSVVPVIDNDFSSTPRYDLVTIGSGDREDPLDLLTSNLVSPASKEAVHNRIYAIRDYNFQTGKPPSSTTSGPWTPPKPLTESDLYDATTDLATLSDEDLKDEITKLKAEKGWLIMLREANAITVPNGLTTTWIGEKVLAETTVIDGVIYATTFTPANDTNSLSTCKANEGVAKEYAVSVFTGASAVDLDDDGDADRSQQIGGGIPSEVVIVFRPDGTTSLVKAGAATPDGKVLPTRELRRTFWLDNDP